MRGKVLQLVQIPIQTGITPAYAGKSGQGYLGGSGGGDHPRVCGEKSPPVCRLSPGSGSPPRMRGKGSAQLLAHLCGGITPAYAGKRTTPAQSGRPARDHPRVCGEKVNTCWRSCRVRGSPPRMRGKEEGRAGEDQEEGITPAYAGKRPAASWPRSIPRDHPRVCGEKVHGDGEYRISLGSPPRMRGKG